MDLIIDEPEPINTGAKLYPKDILNHTLLVWAVEYIEHSPTAYNDGSDPKKPCDVIVVDLVDLDQLDEETGQLGTGSHGSWWRQGRLIQKLKPRLGKTNPLIGRMTKGVGPNGAFELTDLSADERSLARAQAWWKVTGGFTPLFPERAKSQPQVEVQVSAQTSPPPPPSPLEQQANQSLGRQGGESALERLRRLGNQSEEPPF